MDNHWLTMILIALAASFLPLQFGVEIFLLNNDGGLKKTSSFVGGITLFRMLVASLMILLPLSLFVIRPKQAPADLEKVNTCVKWGARLCCPGGVGSDRFVFDVAGG